MVNPAVFENAFNIELKQTEKALEVVFESWRNS